MSSPHAGRCNPWAGLRSMEGHIGVCASPSRGEQPGVRGRSYLLALRLPLWMGGKQVEGLSCTERAGGFAVYRGGFGFGCGVLWKVSVSFPRAEHTPDCVKRGTCLEGLLGLDRRERCGCGQKFKPETRGGHRINTDISTPFIPPARIRPNSLNPSSRYPSWHHPSRHQPAGEASPILLLRRPAHLGWTDRGRQMHLILRHPGLELLSSHEGRVGDHMCRLSAGP